MIKVKINQKVKVLQKDGSYLMGTITKIFPANETHSGRIVIRLFDKGREWESEFWNSDYTKSVINAEKPKFCNIDKALSIFKSKKKKKKEKIK